MRTQSLCVVAVAALAMAWGTPRVASADILIDFESFPDTFTSHTESGVTFSGVGGGDLSRVINPNGTNGLLSLTSPHEEFRADIAGGATSVSVDLGDYNADSDLLFLEIFDAANVSLGYTDLVISPLFVGMETLSLSAPDIAYAIFGARDAVNGSSVYADNFRFQPIPAPGAALLGFIGLGAVGWIKRRLA